MLAACLILVWVIHPEIALAFSSEFLKLAAPLKASSQEAAAAKTETDVMDLLEEVKQLAANGRYVDAISELTNAIEKNPRDPVLFFKRGSLYYYALLSVNAKSADSSLWPPSETAGSFPGPGGLGGLFNHSRPTVPVDYCERALTDFNKAIALKNNYDIFYYMRGLLFTADFCPQRNLWTAITDYDRALVINPRNAVYYLERGRAWARLNYYREAISNINRAIMLAPANYYYYYEKGTIWEKMGMYTEAATSYKSVLELAPSERLFDYGRDLSRARKGDCPALIKDYSELIGKRPAVAAFYVNRAVCYGDLKKYTQAVEDVTTALGLENERRELYFMRAKLNDQRGFQSEARRDYEKACNSNQPTPRYDMRNIGDAANRDERWVPFWSSRDQRKFYFDEKHIMKKDGNRKVVRLRIEKKGLADATPLSSHEAVNPKEKGYTLETWELSCLQSQFRILSRKILNDEGKKTTFISPSEKAFRPVRSDGVSGKLLRRICGQSKAGNTVPPAALSR